MHELLLDVAGWSAERWFVEVVGWGGAALILLAYLLVTVGRLTGRSLAFQWMNLLGAAGFVINGWWHRAIPSATPIPRRCTRASARIRHNKPR